MVYLVPVILGPIFGLHSNWPRQKIEDSARSSLSNLGVQKKDRGAYCQHTHSCALICACKIGDSVTSVSIFNHLQRSPLYQPLFIPRCHLCISHFLSTFIPLLYILSSILSFHLCILLYFCIYHLYTPFFQTSTTTSLYYFLHPQLSPLYPPFSIHSNHLCVYYFLHSHFFTSLSLFLHSQLSPLYILLFTTVTSVSPLPISQAHLCNLQLWSSDYENDPENVS